MLLKSNLLKVKANRKLFDSYYQIASFKYLKCNWE